RRCRLVPGEDLAEPVRRGALLIGRGRRLAEWFRQPVGRLIFILILVGRRILRLGRLGFGGLSAGLRRRRLCRLLVLPKNLLEPVGGVGLGLVGFLGRRLSRSGRGGRRGRRAENVLKPIRRAAARARLRFPRRAQHFGEPVRFAALAL